MGLEDDASTPSEVVEESAPSSSSYAAFSQAQKTVILTIVTSAALSTFISADIYLPLLPTLAEGLNVSISKVNLTVTVFMLVFGIGPLLTASFSDSRGRKPTYTISLLIYIASNIALAAAPAHYASFVVLRIIQGLGASALYSLGAATVADVFDPSQRARAISYFNLGPQLGPAIAPTIGGAIAQQEGWRWTFWLLVIFGGVCLLVIVLALPETLASMVDADEKQPWLKWPPFGRKVRSNPARINSPPPARQTLLALARTPTVIVSSVNTALIFGSYFCLAVSFPTLLEGKYGFNMVEIGLAYLAPGAAMACGSICCGHLSDRSRKRLLSKVDSAEIEPEHRLRPQIIGTAICPVGVLLYAWLGHFGIGVPGVIIGIAICGFALSWTMSTNNTYLTLVRPRQVATAMALSALLMNPSGAIGTAIVAPLIEAEGFGWCFTGIAIVDLICTAMAALSLFKGTSWRKSAEAREYDGGEPPKEEEEGEASQSDQNEIKE